MQKVSLKEFITVLKNEGWESEFDFDKRSKYSLRTVEYKKTIDGRDVRVQLWGDGKHRVSHYFNNGKYTSMSTVPTDFLTVDQMHEAIKIELTRTDHNFVTPPFVAQR